ncbi:MAG: hypothetical protein HYV99_04450 [Betaproteobacteria bacterium]|nr:hypothetical protein [Betaproteobacteria bacterium]
MKQTEATIAGLMLLIAAPAKEAMIVSVLKGKGVMPPKGGNASLTDSDARAAMDYMLSQVK